MLRRYHGAVTALSRRYSGAIQLEAMTQAVLQALLQALLQLLRLLRRYEARGYAHLAACMLYQTVLQQGGLRPLPTTY